MRQHRAELTLLRSLEVRRVQMREDWMAARALANADANAQAHAQEMPSSLVAKMKQLKAREVQLRAALPDYVQKLIGGFELRVYHFELIDCARKLAIVCMPVFFKPSGSVSQLIFGLVVCFVTFAAYIYYAPYVSGDDNRLAQLWARVSGVTTDWMHEGWREDRSIRARVCVRHGGRRDKRRRRRRGEGEWPGLAGAFQEVSLAHKKVS